jgi:hypothetical protein
MRSPGAGAIAHRDAIERYMRTPGVSEPPP